MRYPRRSGDSEPDRGRDPGDGRNYRAGLSGLVATALLAFLVIIHLDHPSPWGITAAVIWSLTLFIMIANSLSRIRNPVLATAGYVGFLIGGVILVGWSFASPHDLIDGRAPDELSVRFRAVAFGLLLLLSVGWSGRRWLRTGQAIRADLASRRPPVFAETTPGYRRMEVDGLLVRLNALPDTAEGRAEGRTLIEGARFQQSRGYGYNTHQVDQHLARLLQHYRTQAAKPGSDSSVTA